MDSVEDGDAVKRVPTARRLIRVIPLRRAGTGAYLPSARSVLRKAGGAVQQRLHGR